MKGHIYDSANKSVDAESTFTLIPYENIKLNQSFTEYVGAKGKRVAIGYHAQWNYNETFFIFSNLFKISFKTIYIKYIKN